jgi:hypothetical protein
VKSGVPVVTAVTDDEPLSSIKAAAAEAGSPCTSWRTRREQTSPGKR